MRVRKFFTAIFIFIQSYVCTSFRTETCGSSVLACSSVLKKTCRSSVLTYSQPSRTSTVIGPLVWFVRVDMFTLLVSCLTLHNLTVRINYEVTSRLSRNLYTGFDSDIIRTQYASWFCRLVTS